MNFDLPNSCEEALPTTQTLRARQARTSSSDQSLEGLYRLADALNAALTERAVVELALERLVAFAGVRQAALKRIEPDGSVRLMASRGAAPVPAVTGDGLACDCERAVLAAASAGPTLCAACAQRAEPHACIALDTGGGTRTLLSLTLVATAAGADALAHAAAGQADEPQAQRLHFLATVGSQIGVAIARARLYDSMAAQVAERTAAVDTERQLLAAVVGTSGALVCMVDGDGLVRVFNPACEAAFDWPASEALGQPWQRILEQLEDGADALAETDAHADARPEMRARVRTSAPAGVAAAPAAGLASGGSATSLARLVAHPPADGGPAQLRGQWRSRDGTLRAIIWSVSWQLRADGSVGHVVCTGVDVTALRGAEAKLHQLRHYDALTGLPNHLDLRERMRMLKGRAAVTQGRQQVGLLLIKPERLRMIAESLGLEAEQAMLRQAATRLSHHHAGATSVGRVSERTFAIAMVATDTEGFADMARQVLAELSLPFLLGAQELHLDPAIGIALYPTDGLDYGAIYQGADAAMRRAMVSKGERYEFYRPSLNQHTHARFQFENALRGALERHELRLDYQLQASLATGEIIGAEALVRWQHPQQGLIGPGLFIPLAEETGMILAIGEWVLRCACEQAMAWQRAGLTAVPVSVNLSARQFSDDAVALVERILAETGLAPHLLELELTESASMEAPEKTIDILCQLKKMGVKMAIDDFGTGYSNLSYLKRFPVDKLKLDQSFVRDLTSDSNDLSIARAVIAMGHGLGLTVIAEGVETAAQLELLAANGCDEIQGYYLSRAVDGGACAALMAKHESARFRR